MLPSRKFSLFQVEAKPEAQIVWKQGLREIGQEVGTFSSSGLWWILLFGGIFLWPLNLMAMLSRWARWWHWSEEDSQSWSWRMWKGRTLALSPVLPKILSERLQPCSSFQVTSSALQVLASVLGETLLFYDSWPMGHFYKDRGSVAEGRWCSLHPNCWQGGKLYGPRGINMHNPQSTATRQIQGDVLENPTPCSVLNRKLALADERLS